VEVRQESLTLPWAVQKVREEPATQPGDRRHWGEEIVGERTFGCVTLENEYLRVRVVPEWGGQVRDAVFKPTGDGLFYDDLRARNYFPFWQAGVRASFPRAEHGMRCMDQPASWRIFRRDDGSVTVAMWMDFSHGRPGEPNAAQFSTHLCLSQHVTLRPGEAAFRVTYRVTNPAPLRVGRQCWNDAFFPRNHGPGGTVLGDARPPEGRTRTQWVYPASFASSHRGEQFRRYDPAEDRIGDANRADTSVFAWDMPYGFAGLWYPQARVNRLRIGDPAEAPGAKQYYRGDGTWDAWGGCFSGKAMYNMVELWGGSDCVFEGVERWQEAGEAWQFAHTFALVGGIGKVDYADANVAVHVELSGDKPRVEAVTLRPVGDLAMTRPASGPKAGIVPCGPTRPAVFALPDAFRGGRVVLEADGKVILDRQFPLEIPRNDGRHEQIKAALKAGAARDEMTGNPTQKGKWDFRNALRGYPPGSAARGRVLLRDGQLAAAVECLSAATAADGNDGEAWHMLGAALAGSGRGPEAATAFARALAAERAYPAARYCLALNCIAQGLPDRAAEALGKLLAQRPEHWEGRLLLAWLEATGAAGGVASAARAAAMEQEDPADPRVAWVLHLASVKRGDAGAIAAAEHTLNALLHTPGAARRLEEFQAAAAGGYMPPLRASTAP
jgi:tetratricopeptide (TPR) repeat protein